MLAAPPSSSPELLDLAEPLGLRPQLEAGRILAALEALLPALYPKRGVPSEASLALRDALLTALRQEILHAQHPPRTRMKFGTSGWRGILLDDFTLRNVGLVTRALVETLLDQAHHAELGVASADALRARGCVIAHDTRMMGPEFAEEAASVLAFHGIRIHWLGMATTPEVSAAIAETGASFSINFTPSHNPFTYHGYKFNPADGGPAPASLTSPVAQRANELIDARCGYFRLQDSAWQEVLRDRGRFLRHDPIALYKQSLKRRLPWFSLDHLIDRINEEKVDLYIDNGFGATSGKYERLLEGVNPKLIHVVHSEQDFLFGGKNREPSVENFRTLQARMKRSRTPFCLGFMNDGDGDRFVGGGREAVLVMNQLGPLIVRYLSREIGLHGDVTRSVMTSHLADAARARYQPGGTLHETSVGFQYMRPFVATSINSWEESDGMSPLGWSLDKDGLLAALLLTDMVLRARQSPEALQETLQQELGTFYFERQKVSGRVSGDALKAALQARYGMLLPGSGLVIDGRTFRVQRLITLDGFKVVFDEGWWFGVRASGTEPVVRPYVETFAPPGADAAMQAEAQRWQQAILGWLKSDILQVIG